MWIGFRRYKGAWARVGGGAAKKKRERGKETRENGEVLQTEMNAMDCSQRVNDREEGKRDDERKEIN